MNRALPLLLLLAVAGGGLAYFALQIASPGADESPRTTAIESNDRPAPKAAEKSSTETEELAAVASLPAPDRMGQAEPARSLEIIPMNFVGQLAAEARITARHRTGERTAAGRTKWESLPSGTWEIVVEAPDEPVWRREVVLAPGETRREVARLGERIKVRGTVVDTNGRPVARIPVFLLPPGVPHPRSKDMKRDLDRPREPMQATNGAITAKVEAGGHFEATVPDAGEFRVSVGRPDDARWTQPKAFELTHGGPDRVTVTVPAFASLNLEITGEKDERPRTVSAYVYDAEMAQMVVDARAATQGKGAPMTVADAQREAKRRAMSGGSAGSEGTGVAGGVDGTDAGMGSTNFTRDQAVRTVDQSGGGEDGGTPRNRPLPPKPETGIFEPGWRMIRSARVKDDGTALLTGLQGDADLRFLFARGKERIITAGTYRLKDGRTSQGKATLPPPGTGPAEGGDPRAVLKVGPSPKGEGEEEAVAGVVWGF